MRLPLRIDTPFFPAVDGARRSGHLDVGDGHAIWWEETGTAEGVPVLVLHGGPGGQIKSYYRRLLDPQRHRGIFFDQRGCGRSLPSGSLENNDTGALVGDMEKLRESCGIDAWVVVGGSWGSTLAIAYAEAFPDRVAALVVTGVFLARPVDQDWTWRGVGAVLPEVVELRNAHLPDTSAPDPRRAFSDLVLGEDQAAARDAAQIFSISELQTLDLLAPQPADEFFSDEEFAAVRIQLHYDSHDYFLSDDQLIENAAAIANIPGAIIAGRSDLCTPPQGAYALAKVWPEARLHIVAAAGHRWNDEALGRYLVAEIDRLTKLVADR